MEQIQFKDVIYLCNVIVEFNIVSKNTIPSTLNWCVDGSIQNIIQLNFVYLHLSNVLFDSCFKSYFDSFVA